MSEAKSTPGPWKLTQEAIDTEWHIITAAGGRIIANIHIESNNRTDEANARLIVAAPESLEANQDVCDEIPNLIVLLGEIEGDGLLSTIQSILEGLHEKAKSVIAKATGNQS